jgi:hypothetical protein
MARICRDDLPDGESGIFLQTGLDIKIAGQPVGQISRPGHSTRAGKFEDFLIDLRGGPFWKPQFSDSSARWRKDIFLVALLGCRSLHILSAMVEPRWCIDDQAWTQ